MKVVLKIAGGNLLLALAVAAFLLPNQLMATGSTGLALVITHWVPLELSVTVAAINVAAFLLGLVFLGWRFAMTTLLSTVLYPFLLSFVQPFFPTPVVQDTLTACICAALLSGAGVGLVIRSGASTGGTDIPAILLNRRFGVPVAVVLCTIDILVLIGQTFITTPDRVLYGVLTAIMISAVSNKVITGGNGQVQMLIISPKFQEINTAICGEMDRGSTLVDVCTGYQRTRQQAVLSVVPHRDLPTLQAKVLSIDPTAFIVITAAHKVYGKGFTLDR